MRDMLPFLILGCGSTGFKAISRGVEITSWTDQINSISTITRSMRKSKLMLNWLSDSKGLMRGKSWASRDIKITFFRHFKWKRSFEELWKENWRVLFCPLTSLPNILDGQAPQIERSLHQICSWYLDLDINIRNPDLSNWNWLALFA